MISRSFMRKGEKITLLEESTGNKKVFSIISKDGAGASSVSYIASCGRKNGRLKEFYPGTLDINRNSGIGNNQFEEICSVDPEKENPISRTADNQLVCSDKVPQESQTFKEMLEAYINAYHVLDNAKKEAEEGENSFSTFIPKFEIFRGLDENGNMGGSVYIWTADNNGDFETFDKYLDKVHKHPTRNPAKAMYTILKTLYNLTECIMTLHTAGLIHSDIKPENFGFFIRGGRYLTEQVQLFDVNSIYSAYSEFLTFTGTKGFCAPEVLSRGIISNQSDIYSIAAVLFYAIALGDDGESRLYADEYYNDIDEIVAASKLLNASPITSSVKFQERISVILKKCLAKEPRDRIKSCNELKKDLEHACVLLIPAQYNNIMDLGSELRIIDKELESFDESDSTFALQSLFFNHPLYENSDEVIKVVLAGFGVYGQQFLDVCLQAGQIKGKKLEITVVTQDKAVYKKEYLGKRRALLDFFEVDGEGDLSDTNYGRILFKTPDEACDESGAHKFAEGFSKTDINYNKELAKELMFNKSDSGYVFISLGEDALNVAVAKACAEIVSSFKLGCTIACVCSDGKKYRGIIPVDMTAKASENENYAEIERMAFNAHLTWSSPLKLNTNLKKIKSKFLEKYNHDSSVACVLAIKNILYACGIELKSLSSADVLEASRKYSSYIKNNKDVFAELVNIEHRRWNVEKITSGWICKTDLSSCVYGPVNDKKKKEHPCLVKSRSDFNLEKHYRITSVGKWDKAKWNEPCAEDALLDDLDMLSLNLHRTLYRAAMQIKSTYSITGEEYRRISWIISDHKEAMISFNEWMLCLKRLWGMDETQTRFYDGYKDAFLNSLKTCLSKPERDEVSRYVGIIDSKVEPLIKAYSMRDYKSSDKDLMNAVPFILTHRENLSLFIPLMIGDNTERFNNVASATVVNPETVTYGVYLRNHNDIKEITDTLSHIISYMDKKDIRAKIRLAVIYHEGDQRIKQRISEIINDLRNMDTRIRRVMNIPVGNESDIAAALSENITADAYENNTAYLSALLVGAGFYFKRPSYSFDSSRKKFTASEECGWLNYIKGDQFITVSDMLSFKNSTGFMDALPEYAEYKDLWNYYKGVSYAWKDMCRILEKHSDINDVVSVFNIDTDLNNTKSFEIIIPNELRDSYIHIISFLRDDMHIVTQDSGVEYRTTESCKVTLHVGQNNIDAARKLFANPFILANQKDIIIVTKPKKVEIRLNNLLVKELNMDDYPECSDKKKKIGEIFKKLESLGHIYNLKNTDDRLFSFIYSTKQSKHLMTNAGRILEIYVYHKLQESNFDDVVSGYEINWEDTDIKSEFDCILTSGFRCLMIECKAQDKISQDYYYKLSCLAKQFGINAIPILIADTHEQVGRDNSVNEMQRERGKMMDVITIYDRNEISNIDMTIRRILNGKY